MEQFIDSLKDLYNKYPICIKNLKRNKYKNFLYLHNTNNIKFLIAPTKDIKIKGKLLYIVKLRVKDNYCKSLITLYQNNLYKEEKEYLNSLKTDDKFYVIFYEEEYTKDEVDFCIDRRDFLIPCFFNKNTIIFLRLVSINDIEQYRNLNKNFFILLQVIRKLLQPTERIGLMVDGSCTLSIHNVRYNMDVDLVIFHPRFYDPKVKEMLLREFHKNLPFIDPYFHDFLDWDGEEKPILHQQISSITKGAYTDFHHVVFNPKFHYYFYGIKIVSLKYNLIYRAQRAYPKNVADLIITKYALKIDVPKIKKIEDKMLVNNEKMYEKKYFIEMVGKYLKKFNFYKFKAPYNVDYEVAMLES
jgi:hypothetical protein